VIYSGYLPKALVESIVRQVEPSAGFTWISKAHTDERGLAREVAKYVTKAPSPMSEQWLGGEEREVMDPTLVARWELATMTRKLSRVYGTLRGAKPPDEEIVEPEEEEPELPESCAYCGVIGEMEMVQLPTQATVAAMHAKGRRALRGSRWEEARAGPPP
jgi:hypothetical protein